jgi:cytochrome c-type biogenesis protein CcmH
VRRSFVLLALLALALAGSARASEQHPTLAEVEKEVICPVCHETLDLSTSPIADRMRTFIRGRIAAGDTKSEIKAKLVDQFGESVLAAPPKHGFNLLAWLLPLVGLVAGAVALGFLARRWSRERGRSAPLASSANGRAPLDPELERRLDEELARFDA